MAFMTAGGVMPALLVAMVVPATEACSGGGELTADSRDGEAESDAVATPFPLEEAGPPAEPEPWKCPSYIVEIPPAGTPAEPGQLCAVPSPVSSNVAARVTLSNYVRDKGTATGFVSVPPDIEPTIVGLPTITVQSADSAEAMAMSVTNVTKVTGGYQFDARWAEPLGWWRMQMTVQTSFAVSCGDGGTTTVEALTKLDLCKPDYDEYEWVSSGEACTICEVIAEMAPSPIVSDKTGDDLPLGMVLRLRVVEVARAGRHVLLFADNDAGAAADYEWRVSEGSIEHIADDVVLWTLPEKSSGTPFGQVAVWNEAGAAVENFISSVTWQVAA
ncbi:MAG: hypothetical protein BGO98_29025 [Myxococcales bacterium 68-20]|nr:MAG: hypothetical protein BGO98_29025 [Myxococcales bacterium 68-20]